MDTTMKVPITQSAFFMAEQAVNVMYVGILSG